MIMDLAQGREEIALPGLGVFVVEEVSASFSDRGYTVNPPYKRLAFRQKESADNSLIMLYAQKNSVSQKDAATILGGFFKRLAAVLKEKKSVSLPGLGRLRSTNENIFFFVQSEEADINPQGFGLESISLKTLNSAYADEDLFLDVTDDVPEEIPGQAGDDVGRTGDDVRRTGNDGERAGDDSGVAAPEAAEAAGKGARVLKIALLGVLAAVALFFALLAILGRVAPQLVDPLLYNPKELEMLHNLL